MADRERPADELAAAAAARIDEPDALIGRLDVDHLADRSGPFRRPSDQTERRRETLDQTFGMASQNVGEHEVADRAIHVVRFHIGPRLSDGVVYAQGAFMRSPRPLQATPLLAALLILSGCASGGRPSLTSPVAPTSASAASAATPTTPAASRPATMPVDPNGTPIHLVKDCSTFTGEIPSYCSISSSDYAPIPVGAKVNYLGPLLINPHFLSSNVVIDDDRGSTATGFCSFDARPTEDRGLCTFWGGTGGLARFTAIFVVSIDATGEWHLDGESYGMSPSPMPS
jgi:hypothetical protein